jgi:signal transduction histidine kinase
VRITDTGPGVPPHQLARLFQPFYTTKAAGTGLGLCLSRKYVRAHGGDLIVTSPVAPSGAPGEAPRGTAVQIILPVTAPEQASLPAGREGPGEAARA